MLARLRELRPLRWLIVALTIAVMAVTTLTILATWLRGWTFGLGNANLPARIGTIVAVCAFILVAATLIVALIAYLAATGKPDLHAELHFPFSEVNKPVFRSTGSLTAEKHRIIMPFKQVDAHVVLVNRSSYSARNPGMRIELVGLGGLDATASPGWTPIVFASTVGVTTVQWDGGADFIVHGGWTRVLPAFRLRDQITEYRRDPPPELVVTVAADGIQPRTERIPVRILDPDEDNA